MGPATVYLGWMTVAAWPVIMLAQLLGVAGMFTYVRWQRVGTWFLGVALALALLSVILAVGGVLQLRSS